MSGLAGHTQGKVISVETREAETGRGEGAGACSHSQGVGAWILNREGTDFAVWREELGLRPALLLVEKQ